MLDQNTDRSWWMIGSIVVGALMIALAKVAFPTVFNTIIEQFKTIINGVDPTLKEQPVLGTIVGMFRLF